MSRIMGFVRLKAVSAAEISGSLGLTPAEVARHLDELSQEGLIRFDENQTCVTTS
jgi:predicted ArsR family transcriptional regulator